MTKPGQPWSPQNRWFALKMFEMVDEKMGSNPGKTWKNGAPMFTSDHPISPQGISYNFCLRTSLWG
jgi:hypothetical protein